MLIRNVHYAEKPKKVVITTCGSVSVVEFPLDVQEVIIEGEEDRVEYVADSVYSLTTMNTANLRERIEGNYEEWLEKAKEVVTPKTSLEDVMEAVNALAEIVIGE